MEALSSTDAPREPEAGAGEPRPAPGPGYPLLVVRTSNYRAGIPVAHVREVLIRRRVTRVPDAEFPLLGLLSLRGDMVTVFDLGGLQAAADRDGSTPAASDTTGLTTGAIRPNRLEAVVVLRGGKDSLGLVVDGVEDIQDFRPKSEDPAAGAEEPAPSGAEAPAPKPPASLGAEAPAPKLPAPPAPADAGAKAPRPRGPIGEVEGTPFPEVFLAPAPGRLWAGIVRDAKGEIGVLDAEVAMETAIAVSRVAAAGGEEELSLEVAENGAGAAPGGMMGGGASRAPGTAAAGNREDRRDG